ncbi:hypothetical protein MU582_08490 [Nocardioidaceae bacterium SCSIO 66511]|nr:hypothetical protein MU582_08490 [Nocardioidaceae bacterium SCSIO 66511]
MITKKMVAATAVAAGLTATAGASYAANDGSDAEQAATAKTQSAVVKADRAKTAAAAKTSAEAKRKCVSVKKMKRIRVFMPYKKVMKILPKATRKSQSGGLRFRYFNACTSSLNTDFDVVFKKRKGKWTTYDVSVFWS